MKSVIDRESSTLEVVAASRRWAAPTAAGLETLLGPELEPGENLPDMELLQKLFARALERRCRNLSAADGNACDAEQRRGELNAERGTALPALYREVVDLRRVLRGIFGTAGGRFLGLQGETSRDPLLLLRQADRAVARLCDLAKSLPPSTFDWNEMRQRWAAPIAAAATVLRSLDGRARLAVKEVEAAVVDRQQALGEFNAVLVRAAGWLEGTYRAAGFESYAAAVRPSHQRPGRLLDDVRRQAARKKKKRIRKVAEAASENVQNPNVRKPEPGPTAALARVLPFPVAAEVGIKAAVDSPASGPGLLRQWAAFLGLGREPRRGGGL